MKNCSLSSIFNNDGTLNGDTLAEKFPVVTQTWRKDVLVGVHGVGRRILSGHVLFIIGVVAAIPQGQRGWSRFYEKLLEHLPDSFCGVYIDSVHSMVMDQWCLRHGFSVSPDDKISYYKLTNCKHSTLCQREHIWKSNT